MAITKIDITMLEDVGGANNLVKLDANAKIPAAVGVSLLNVPGPFTSTSDPAINSNKTLGFEWVNSTSGEMYVCTDATVGENIWINVGEGIGDIAVFPGTAYGYGMGGGNNINVIDRFSFTSQSNATDVGDCTRYYYNPHTGSSSSTHGYAAGGDDGSNGPYSHNVINKVQFVATADATDVGDLTLARYSSAGASSSNHGYAAGGRTAAPTNVDNIDKWTFASDANATDVGNLLSGVRHMAGHSSQTYGYKSGGYPTTDSIEKWSFATDGNSTDVANLVTSRRNIAGTSSIIYGYTCGAYPVSDEIEKFIFATDTNATDVGNLYADNDMFTGISATDYGYLTGGRNNANVIQRFSHTSDGDSVDWADLTISKTLVAGTQY